MAAHVFRLDKGSEQERFLASRAQIAFYTGGYGNGKTATLGVEAIIIASQYRAARVLVGRATRPKLEDSTKPELLKWLPKDWVAKWPSERNNNIVLKSTGSTIEFRHIRQEGKGKGEEQSNLLSATYDAVFIDQIDDPEFTYKDFADMIGRLRGTAQYVGDDRTMPEYGPQWFRAGANPTRNWLFREVVGPYFTYKKTGLVTTKLLRDEDTKEPIVEVFNAPTQANSKNTGKAYAKRMESVFRGSMKRRMIDGEWDAYEGLVYPDYKEEVHTVESSALARYIKESLARDELGLVESYDYGQVSPSCYLLAFYNEVGDILITDGFYGSKNVNTQAKEIKRIRMKWGVIPKDRIYADPDIFRGKHATADDVGEAIATMFQEKDIDMQRASNAIETGIEKVSSYLVSDDMHRHPITRQYGAPRLFVSSELEFWHNEIVDYYWNKNTHGDNVDKPRDRNDHAMDATKYLLTRRSKVIGALTTFERKKIRKPIDPRAFVWGEVPDDPRGKILPRYM